MTEGQFAKSAALLFLILFLLLLLGIPNLQDLFAAPALGGISWGHWLVLALHVMPVAAAWYYIVTGTPSTTRQGVSADHPSTGVDSNTGVDS